MLTNIAIGQYLHTGSAVHCLDPRTKLWATLVLMASVFLTRSVPFHLFLALFLGIVLILSRIPPRLMGRNLRSFLWLFLITFGLHALTTPGEPLSPFPVWKINVTYQGLENGALFSLRLGLLIVTAALLMLTTSPMELTDGLERLLSPLRRLGFPVQELAMMMVITLRFIPLFFEEAERLRKAQLARGARFGGHPVRRARSLVALMVPLFLLALRRADELALAMEARCYQGEKGRTSFNQLHLRLGDYLTICIVGIIGCGGVLL